MQKVSSLALFICLFFTQLSFGQIAEPIQIKAKKNRTFYFSWGYNRESYSKSDIRFKNTTSDNYDFILVNAPAHDKPGFNHGFNDFVQKDLTIPQYNAHIGYLFNDKQDLGIEISWDHLKYVVYDNYTMHVKGQIRGQQIDKDTLVTPNFVHLQHTNGNNYLMVNIVKLYTLFKYRNMDVQAVGKFGVGPMYSYTISTVLGSENGGGFKVQGFVMGLNLGARLNLFKYVFLQPAFQYAFADYTGSPISADGKGRATHVFSSYMFSIEGGINIPLKF